MKVRTTIRSIFMLIISIAAGVLIILPFVSYPKAFSFTGEMEHIFFYDLLKFEEFNALAMANESLGLLREISSYLTIAVIASAGLALISSLFKLVLYKSKFFGFLAGVSYLLLTISTLGLGICAVVYSFIFKKELTIESLEISVDVTSIGGWIYASLGLLSPITIGLTNLIKK